MIPRVLSLVACSALWLTSVSCASNEATFGVRFAPGFAPPHHAVSVFGVYKDGQMSAEAWEALAPRLASWLGTDSCAAAYVDGANAKADAPLWAAVDDYTRSNGPTDDLLAEMAPASRGDLVMVLTVAGKVPEQEKVAPGPSTQPSMSGGGGGRGMGGMGGGMGGTRGANPGAMRHDRLTPAGAKDALDLAVLLYSPAEKKSVAEVSLEYTGHNLDDALAKFTAKLRESLPGASCAAWAWDSKVDPERVRRLGVGE
jgi:hypothetical protein